MFQNCVRRIDFALSLSLPLLCAGVCLAAAAPTTTLLGLSASSVPAGTAVTLTGIVLSNNLPVSPGLVTFQDGKAVIGSAQIVPAAGSASIKVRLGLGVHQLTAHFAGTNAYAKSASQADPFTVTGTVPTTTAIRSSGSPGNYTLTGTVTNSGLPAPTGTVSFIDQTNKNQLGSAALGAGTATQTFQAQQTFPAATNPSAIAVADLNGDGIPDVVVANFLDGTVSVFLANADGTFQPLRTFGVSDEPTSIAVGDFNGDGIPDLAVANAGNQGGVVSVLLGVGDGSFQPQQTFGPLPEPIAVAVGDFNGDGIPDLAVADAGAGSLADTVSVLLGNGDGSFQPPQAFPAGEEPIAVAVGDFNGDGVPDLAVANDAGTVSVLLGNGQGSFQPQQTYPAGNQPFFIVTGDFNGDGVPDLATANSGDGTISVLLGVRGGTFQQPQLYTVGGSPQSLTVADFNGDGMPDLATTDGDDNAVAVLLNRGDGTFGPKQTYNAGSFPVPAAGDFNGDGIPDLAVLNGGDGTLQVLLNSLTQSAKATLKNTAVIGTGTHQVAASYGGDSYHQTSTSSSIGLTATQITTSLSLNASASTIAVGQPVTFRAALNVYASGSLTTNGEMVAFYNGSTSIGTAALSNGQATLTTTALPVGPDTITAQYAGDQNFTASTSNSVTVTVSPAPNFTITANPPAETVRRGDVAAFILQLKSVNGFNANVTLSCSGGPAGSKCADFPQTVHVNGTAYAVSGILFPKNTTPGTYTLTFTGVSGALTNSTTAKFTVK